MSMAQVIVKSSAGMAKGWRGTSLQPLEGRTSTFLVLNELGQVISVIFTKGSDNYREIEDCLKGIATRQRRLNFLVRGFWLSA